MKANHKYIYIIRSFTSIHDSLNVRFHVTAAKLNAHTYTTELLNHHNVSSDSNCIQQHCKPSTYIATPTYVLHHMQTNVFPVT